MSLLNTGIKSLNASQLALQTTGHNIANANTAGYSRQTVAFETAGGQNLGNGYIGHGVDVASVMRVYDALLGKQAAAAGATSSADKVRAQALTQMQEVFSGGDSGLGAAINNMMNAFADVEAAPTDSTARNVVLTQMNELAARFRAASNTLDELDYTTRQQITNNVGQVNSLAAQVATLNGQISRALATGHTPNDLLDSRDQLVRQINQYVKTSQVDADDGSLTLFVGGSQALVLGTTSAQLAVAETTEYPGSGKLSLYFSQPAGQRVELTAAMVGGGEVAGLLKFNNDDLVEGRNLLGRLVQAVGTELNTQNQLGLTLTGTPGSKLFDLPAATPGYSNIAGYLSNPPSATATFTDSKAFVASDYKAVFGNPASSSQLVRLSDGQITPFDGSAAASLTVDGIRFDIGVSGNPGESILFKPFGPAAHGVQALVLNPDDLAVANPVTATISADNQGTMQLAALKATGQHWDAATSQVVTTGVVTLPPSPVAPATTGGGITLTFAADGSFTVSPAPSAPPINMSAQPPVQMTSPYQYTAGQAISIDGWEITLQGTPQAGDTVTVGNARDAQYGDSWKRNAGNATSFLALRDAAMFDNGTTLSDGFAAAMAVVGTRTQSAQYAAQLSGTIAENLEADRTAVSGVNLDEEAAKLLQYQQSYQASAKMLQIAQTIFDSMLQSVVR